MAFEILLRGYLCLCLRGIIRTDQLKPNSMIYTAVSRKVVGRSARDNPERRCGLFLVHCFSKKFKRMAREAMDVCLRGLKETTKVGSTATVSRTSVLIISHITFRDCRVHSFCDNLSRNSCIHFTYSAAVKSQISCLYMNIGDRN